jgi:phosphoribosylformylglycinamidine synthase subunit PurL
MAFRAEGDVILLLDGADGRAAAPAKNSEPAQAPAHSQASPSAPLREFSSSEYARTIAGVVAGTPPPIDLAAEKRLIEALVALATEGLLASAHDLSDGGLATALAESGFASDGLTADVDLSADAAGDVARTAHDPAEISLFGERGARAIVSVQESSLARVHGLAAQWSLGARVIGRVTRGAFHFRYNGATVIRDSSASLRAIWAGAIETAVLGERAAKQP